MSPAARSGATAVTGVLFLCASTGAVQAQATASQTRVIAEATGNWGLDRIDQPTGLNGRFTATATGKGVHIYFLDTGVTDRTGSVFPEFTDRWGRSRVVERRAISGGDPDDCDVQYNGHGTRSASLAAGNTFGVAPGAIIHSIKNCDANTANPGPAIVHGIDSIVASVHDDPSAAKKPKRTRIINISFGPLSSTVTGMRAAIQRAIEAGFLITASAGCRDRIAASAAFGSLAAPAFQSQGLVIVAGTDKQDRTFRDYGPGVTLFAPATQTASVDKSGRDSVAPLYKTAPPEHCADSWAAPHAAGVAALYVEAHPDSTPAQVYAALVAAAAPGLVTFNGRPVPSSTNRILQLATTPSVAGER